jgi:hypothetical protein
MHRSGRQDVLDLTDGSVQQCSRLFVGITWNGFGEPSKNVVICSLTTSGKLLGFCVQGKNPRRECEDSVERCIAEIASQVETTWADSIAREQAKLCEGMASDVRLKAKTDRGHSQRTRLWNEPESQDTMGKRSVLQNYRARSVPSGHVGLYPGTGSDRERQVLQTYRWPDGRMLACH